MINEQSFVLFSNCIPVRGFKRSIICDLQNSCYYVIPNDLYNVLTRHDNESINQIKSNYSKEDNQTIKEYFEFLENQDLGFFTDAPENFPKLSLEWAEPAVITNAIIDNNLNTKHDFALIFRQLESLGCKDIQLRFFDKIKLTEIYEVMDLLELTRVKSIELIISLDLEEDKLLDDLLSKYVRIQAVTVHSFSQNKVCVYQNRTVIFSTAIINDETHCGVVSSKYFTINTKMFTESIDNNSCLNRKVGIDKYGNIKNCPSHPKSYGNINEVKLDQVVFENEFQKIWSVGKDEVKVCQDCEFRYICPDCRVYTESDEADGKPSKCNYNPYSGKWGEG